MTLPTSPSGTVRPACLRVSQQLDALANAPVADDALTDDALSPADRHEVLAHLECCPECRASLAQRRALVDRLHRVRDRVEAPASLRARIRAELRRGNRNGS